MKNICFVTASRSEYGLLKWLMKDISNTSIFKLQLIVTGGHLLSEQGYTIENIKNDGFNIDEIIDVKLDTTNKQTIASSMGRLSENIASAYERLNPDLLVVLGDRYELLSICSTAFIMRIPIAHISGGDITEGAIDDGVRNAVTMLATYHFPGTVDSAQNIKRMINSNKNIWTVGEPGLDAFNRLSLLSRNEISDLLSIPEDKKWVLFTYHPETKKDIEYNMNAVKNCVESLKRLENIHVISTYANTDSGGKKINEYLEMNVSHLNSFTIVPSLGQIMYLSVMKQASFVIGNSSSGIVEAPYLNIPTINIGNRQKGRYLCQNIIQTDTSSCSIQNALSFVLTYCDKSVNDNFYWGDGHTSEKIINILSNL